MTRAIIHATGSCFDDAVAFVEQVVDVARLREPDAANAFRIVHAVCVSPTGVRWAHAWCEDRSGEPAMAWQAGVVDGRPVFVGHELGLYVAAHRVELMTRYTLRMWSELNVATGHYGPWRREYLALTRQGRGAAGLPTLVDRHTSEAVGPALLLPRRVAP